MSIVVQSRFACLKVEDDEMKPSTNNNNNNGDKKKMNINNKVIKKQNKKKDNEPSKKNNAKQSTQVKKEKSKKKVATEKQWEEWQQRDNEFMTGCFEQELRNAIFMSKLEYEEEVKQQIKSNHSEKKIDKKKKNKAISLDEFLASTTTTNTNAAITNTEKVIEDKFFENVQLQIDGEIEKDKLIQRRKEREANIEEVITISQYQEKLDKEKQKNVILQNELELLKSEMVDVKSRNKTLCGILGHGEMKDKAGVLLELENLQTVRNELTEEVTKLHALLEQERSKVASLQSELQQHNKHKDKKNKKSMPNNNKN